jgi:hypothetical protein
MENVIRIMLIVGLRNKESKNINNFRFAICVTFVPVGSNNMH